MQQIKLILLVMVITLGACQQNGTDTQLLAEAGLIHEQAVQKEGQLKPAILQLIQEKNRIQTQGKELSEVEMAFVEKVSSIEESYRFFTENHVEVPGYEHEEDHSGHDHGPGEHHHHDHDHDHGGSELKVSAADMVIIQKEFRDTILSIEKRMNALRN